jgi:hypothetical protein
VGHGALSPVMSQSVRSSRRAVGAAQEMNRIVDGDLRASIDNLRRCGQVLSSPNAWDSRLAQDFRTLDWPQTRAALERMSTRLRELQEWTLRINQDIMTAGDEGGASGAPAAAATPGGDPHGLQELAPITYAGVYASVQSFFNAASRTWARPETLQDHAWGGPSRSGPPHGPDFKVSSKEEYATRATKFLQEAKENGYEVKVDGRGNVRVYDPATNTFGAYNADGTTKTFYKPADGARYWARQPGSAPAGSELEVAMDNAAKGVQDASSWLGKIGRVMDTPVGRAGGRALGVLGAAGDVLTIVHPSQNALGGPTTERVAAAANLGAMAVTAGPMAGVLAANAATDWIPGVGEVVMAATAAYFVGDLIYQNRQAIGHFLSSAGSGVAHVASDVAHNVGGGVSHAWHSVFG